jgi:hypothetical protein
MANDRDIKRGRQEDIDTEPRAVKRLCSELAVAYNSSSALDVGKNQSSLMEVKSKGTEDSGPIPPGCVVSKDDDQPDICFGTVCCATEFLYISCRLANVTLDL